MCEHATTTEKEEATDGKDATADEEGKEDRRLGEPSGLSSEGSDRGVRISQ